MPGFPIRTSTDRSLEGSSPWLFAASRVLLRLQAPRHPPLTISNLENIDARARYGILKERMRPGTHMPPRGGEAPSHEPSTLKKHDVHSEVATAAPSTDGARSFPQNGIVMPNPAKAFQSPPDGAPGGARSRGEKAVDSIE